mmetsp:Transcript_12740/g.21360  ORF Transcript_12740/g.21360 Transcript_12740/m.21360 type:complete len:85 (+) Transcript_12740:495-749(+)
MLSTRSTKAAQPGKILSFADVALVAALVALVAMAVSNAMLSLKLVAVLKHVRRALKPKRVYKLAPHLNRDVRCWYRALPLLVST